MKRILLILLAFLLLAGVGAGLLFHTPDLPRRELEAAYLADRDDVVQAAGMTLHVRDDGPRDAPALVMIHGFGSSLHTWEPWAAALADDYRVIRFDLPGHGLTGGDPTGDYTDDRSVAVVDAVLDALKVDRATLIGNSLGGLIAWKYAAAHPARVEKLVLIAPGGWPRAGYSFNQRAEVPVAFKAMRWVLPESFIRQSMSPMYGDPSKLTEDMVRRYWDMLRAPGVREALIRRLEQFELTDPVPVLSGIRAPTLLMWGEKDAMVPFADAEKFADALPDDRLVSYPDLGHMPMEEAPARTLADLEAFLAD